jgi:hypothetical protein
MLQDGPKLRARLPTDVAGEVVCRSVPECYANGKLKCIANQKQERWSSKQQPSQAQVRLPTQRRDEGAVRWPERN